MKSEQRDLIIIAGQNAVGKSLGIKYLTRYLTKRGVTCEDAPVPGYRLLREFVIADDLRGGHNHFHDWCPETDSRDIKGHTHNTDRDTIEPFTVIANTLPDEVACLRYKELADLPYMDSHFWVTDIVGGVNTNAAGTVSSLVDYSFARRSRLLENGIAPSDWLTRVYAVIHLRMDEQKRESLFEQRNFQMLARAEAMDRQVIYIKPKESLYMYGRDDFPRMIHLFSDSGVSHIYEVKNAGDFSYFRELRHVSNELFPKEST